MTFFESFACACDCLHLLSNSLGNLRNIENIFLLLQISIGKQWKEFLDYNDTIGFIFHVSRTICVFAFAFVLYYISNHGLTC